MCDACIWLTINLQASSIKQHAGSNLSAMWVCRLHVPGNDTWAVWLQSKGSGCLGPRCHSVCACSWPHAICGAAKHTHSIGLCSACLQLHLHILHMLPVHGDKHARGMCVLLTRDEAYRVGLTRAYEQYYTGLKNISNDTGFCASIA